MDLAVPGFVYQGVHLEVPVDLPEGGFLQVVVGDNPMGQAIPSRQIPKGCMVCILPANVAEHVRPGLNAAAEYANDPAKMMAKANGNNGAGRIVLP